MTGEDDVTHSFNGVDFNDYLEAERPRHALTNIGSKKIGMVIALAALLTMDMYLPGGLIEQIDADWTKLFGNDLPPDIVHAWTPRENVRLFCERLRSLCSFALLVHLEDNEELILLLKNYMDTNTPKPTATCKNCHHEHKNADGTCACGCKDSAK